MRHSNNSRILLRYAHDLEAFASWLQESGDRLIASADLLGGSDWAIRATDVVGRSIDIRGLKAVERDLFEIHKLLHLELVDDLDSHEAERFLAIHPDDHRADVARLCAEKVDRGLRAMMALDPALASEPMEVV